MRITIGAGMATHGTRKTRTLRAMDIPSLNGAVSHPLLTIRELAEWLRLRPASVYRLARADEIPAIKVGKEWRFSRDSIEHWILDRMADETALIKEPGPWLIDARRPRRGVKSGQPRRRLTTGSTRVSARRNSGRLSRS
jgi:excisionase family DNA binding protein